MGLMHSLGTLEKMDASTAQLTGPELGPRLGLGSGPGIGPRLGLGSGLEAAALASAAITSCCLLSVSAGATAWATAGATGTLGAAAGIGSAGSAAAGLGLGSRFFMELGERLEVLEVEGSLDVERLEVFMKNECVSERYTFTII